MYLVPYVMIEDEKYPHYAWVYSKLKGPLRNLMKRTYAILKSPTLLHEYAYHGFIYKGTRYLGIYDPTRKPLPILVDEVCPEFPAIHAEYLEILELKDRMFRALRQHKIYMPPYTFMDGELYPEHPPHIDFYLKVQEEYLEYIGRFLILRGIK